MSQWQSFIAEIERRCDLVISGLEKKQADSSKDDPVARAYYSGALEQCKNMRTVVIAENPKPPFVLDDETIDVLATAVNKLWPDLAAEIRRQWGELPTMDTNGSFAMRSLADYTDEEIAAEHGSRMLAKLGDQRKGVSVSFEERFPQFQYDGPCDHKHYKFEQHGRSCTCGALMVDFGD